MDTYFAKYKNIIRNLAECTSLSQTEIAKVAGISQGRVSQIINEPEDYQPAKRGRKPKMTKEQKEELKTVVENGSKAAGYENDGWSATRIQETIKNYFDIEYSLMWVVLFLRTIGYSRKKRVRKNGRQDPEKLKDWQENRLPALKAEAVAENRTVVYIDESTTEGNNNYRKTYSLRGQPDEIEVYFSYQGINVIGGICEDGRLIYQTDTKRYNSEGVIKFLKHLGETIDGKLTIISDNAPIHKSKAVKTFIEQQQGRIKIAYQPPYSPEVNPIEQAWGYLKTNLIEGISPKNLTALHQKVEQGLACLKKMPEINAAFFRKKSVAFY